MNTESNVRVTADDDVPAEVRRTVAKKAESIIRGAGSGDHVEITIRKRKNPSEIYSVRVGTAGDGFQHDFQPGDLESERFDIWLGKHGKHLDENCWCGHASEDHAIPQCNTCEV